MALFGSGASFDPSRAGSLLAWYRADRGVTIATGVSQWNDLSGNARHLLQATGANQPTFGATSGANSTPGITFAGSPQTMAVTFSAISQPLHTFAIIRTTNLGTGNGGVICGAAVGERPLVVGTANTNMFSYFGGTGITYAHTDTTNHFLWEVLSNGASSSVIRGNTAAGTGSVGSNTFSGITLGLLPGNASYAAFIISEIAIYPATISGANLTALRAYFAARYAVATQ